MSKSVSAKPPVNGIFKKAGSVDPTRPLVSKTTNNRLNGSTANLNKSSFVTPTNEK